jgi:hypothetical protein
MSVGTFLNGRAPDQPRGLLWLSLSDTGYVLASSWTDDTGGGGAHTWGTAALSVPCRLDPMGTRSRLTGGKIDERSTHVVTVAPGTPIGAADRFLISGRGTFEVTAMRERTAEASMTFEVMEIV